MSGLNPERLLRRVSTLPVLQLGGLFAAGMLVVLLLRAGADARPSMAWLNVPAGLLVLALVSILFSVVAFYRDDDLLEGGVLLAGISGVGTGVAFAIGSVLVTGSIGAAVIMAAGGSFVLLVRLVLLVPIYMAALWIARRFRRLLAPDTL